jgi:hypothetical protein
VRDRLRTGRKHGASCRAGQATLVSLAPQAAGISHPRPGSTGPMEHRAGYKRPNGTSGRLRCRGTQRGHRPASTEHSRQNPANRAAPDVNPARNRGGYLTGTLDPGRAEGAMSSCPCCRRIGESYPWPSMRAESDRRDRERIADADPPSARTGTPPAAPGRRASTASAGSTTSTSPTASRPTWAPTRPGDERKVNEGSRPHAGAAAGA